ncbi:hypothetical protein ONZ45_g6081 [Pleurotus djamor]|nr:hypothetical protein ONZ45_g6081 [Pleurotus djamor]
MSDVPSLEAINGSSGEPDSALATTLTLLLEPSPVLIAKVVPTLSSNLQEPTSSVATYTDLIDATFRVIRTLDTRDKAEFISGHPRIGETKNLSNLSAKEQGAVQASNPTPPEVLARLAYLNMCYERVYPGLRYITFVNGRSRAEIVEEMEGKLGIDHTSCPEVENLEQVEIEGTEWSAELERAIGDVAKIAKSRLQSLNLG